MLIQCSSDSVATPSGSPSKKCLNPSFFDACILTHLPRALCMYPALDHFVPAVLLQLQQSFSFLLFTQPIVSVQLSVSMLSLLLKMC